MVRLVVAYGPPHDPAAFDHHSAETHSPLAQTSRISDVSRPAG
jgi:hypothetical protein